MYVEGDSGLAAFPSDAQNMSRLHIGIRRRKGNQANSWSYLPYSESSLRRGQTRSRNLKTQHCLLKGKSVFENGCLTCAFWVLCRNYLKTVTE